MEPVLIGVVVVLVILVLWGISQYNNFISLRERSKKAWNDIDIQLKRRFDLIPNLVNTVKGYMTHESETFEKITKMRANYQDAETVGDKAAVVQETNKLVRDIIVSVENYPELKANTNFTKLQDELQNTEDKIAYARQFYNDITTRFNEGIQLFPGNIIAGIFGFKAIELFEIDEVERENVKVEF